MGAQFDSEAVYHNMIKELEEKNVIFCDTDTALKKYPEIFPWLSDVMIFENYRGRGYGKILLQDLSAFGF